VAAKQTAKAGEIWLASEAKDGLLNEKQMLYECWQKIVGDRKNEIALRDLASGRSWTFARLNEESEKPLPEKPSTIYPQGNSPEFVIAVLRAWRENIVVCPLDAHQKQPVAAPPPPCCHFKITPASTGTSRAVAFNGGQLAADAENIVTTMGLRPDWPNLAVISMAYSYGFSNLVLPLLLHGIPLYLAPSPLPEVLRCATKSADLTVAAVPALWHAWHKAGAILSNVKLAISAGAALPLTLERAVFAEQGVKIHNFYGTTECGGIAYDATGTPRTDDASVGRPLNNVGVEIDPAGALVVRSRAVGENYWPQPEPALGGGIFKTCDLAEFRDGEIHLRGRTDDHINVAGRKVSPVLIEQALGEHEAVAECVVFGVPSGRTDQMDAIVACVATDKPVAKDELKNFLLLKLPAWQVPRDWWLVDAIGSNGSGKPSRTQWRRAYLENRAPKTAA
jgi:acyl-CoA synthetase (AMP-forming)/AMP-acid ligase II